MSFDDLPRGKSVSKMNLTGVLDNDNDQKDQSEDILDQFIAFDFQKILQNQEENVSMIFDEDFESFFNRCKDNIDCALEVKDMEINDLNFKPKE